MVSDLERQIEKLASAYVPEWRYHRTRPDTGSTLANLYAELMEEIIQCYDRMPERNRMDFLDRLGVEQLLEQAAEGYLTFQLVREDMTETVVPAGSGVMANGSDGSLCRFDTLEDVYVTASGGQLTQERVDGMWYLMLEHRPSKGVISLLCSMEQSGSGSPRMPLWEYFGDEEWSNLQAEDRTDGLTHTGIVRFSGMPDWGKTEICGREGYWMRIRYADGTPLLCGDTVVYGNAAPVKARDPGKQGNIPPQTQWRLMKTIGAVSGAVNPDALGGGCAGESRERAATRGSARIRHRFRAVTPGDFERLVYEICPDVRMVKCFPGYGGDGAPRTGAVTVVVMAEDYPEGRAGFYRTQDRVMQYLKARADCLLVQSGDLSVTGPVPIRIHVACELCADSYREVLKVQQSAGEALSLFLNPVKGNHDGNGWEFGEIPGYESIKSRLLEIPGVSYLKSLRIAYQIETKEGTKEILWEWLKNYPWSLPEAGDIQIAVMVGR